MKDRRVELKVKIKSLAEEARIIRLEERKAKERGDYSLLFRLQNHRREVVRAEARKSLIAYHFVRGRALRNFPEDLCRKPLPADIIDFAVRFGPVKTESESWASYEARLTEWRENMVADVNGISSDVECNRLVYESAAGDRSMRRINRRMRCESRHAAARSSGTRGERLARHCEEVESKQ